MTLEKDISFWDHFGESKTVTYPYDSDHLPLWLVPKTTADIIVNYRYMSYMSSLETSEERMFEWEAEIIAPKETIYQDMDGITQDREFYLMDLMRSKPFKYDIKGIANYKVFLTGTSDELIGQDFEFVGYTVKPEVTNKLIIPKSLLEMFDTYTKNYKKYYFEFNIDVTKETDIRTVIKFRMDLVPF